jgi:hypothetical protein
VNSAGTQVPLLPVGLATNFDLSHAHTASCRNRPLVLPRPRWFPVVAAPKTQRSSDARPRPGISLCTSITRKH